MKLQLLLLSLLILMFCVPVGAQEDSAMVDSLAVDSLAALPVPAPVTDIGLSDLPNDHGHAVVVEWTPSTDDGSGLANVVGYQINYGLSKDGPLDSVGFVPSASGSYEHVGSKDENDRTYIPDHTDLYYRVDVKTVDGRLLVSAEVAGPVQSSGQWYNTGRTAVLIAVALFSFLTIFYVQQAKAGKEL